MTNYDRIRIHGSGIDAETDSSILSEEFSLPDEALRAVGELQSLREAVDARKSPPPEKSLAAMQVIVDYRISPRSFSHTVRGEDHIFDVEIPFAQDLEKKPINAFALREKFLCAQGWSGAFDFLRVTGPFSMNPRVSLKEFERWQEFTQFILVKEKREALASSLREGDWTGDSAEVLKALTGLYPSSFFAGVGISSEVLMAHTEPYRNSFRDGLGKELAEMGRVLKRPLTPEEIALVNRASIENERERLQRIKGLCAWFQRPPNEACSIRWVPRGPEEWNEAQKLLKAGRVLLNGDARPGFEFLLPRTALMPVLVIEARCSLQAIAASIYADYWDGVEHKRCPECGMVFRLGAGKRVGRWQEREHCSDKCKQVGVNRNRPRAAGKKTPKSALGSKSSSKAGPSKDGEME